MINYWSIIGHIDNDKNKVKRLFKGKPVYQPDILVHDKDCRIVILTMSYPEIMQQIEESYPWMAGRVESSLLFTKQRLISRYENTKEKKLKI